jgi:hypothetical protein
MTTIAFTRNYTDRSNDTGFQFEFFCDKCGNGHMTSFRTNTLSVFSKVVSVISSFFGGRGSNVVYAGDQAKDIFRGKSWDSAYSAAVAECKQHFKQCSRCGLWVCPEHCWNVKAGLCEACAPDLNEEAAAIAAQVAREQLWEKARHSDQTEGTDMTRKHVAACPHCGKKSGGGKFCQHCGKSLGEVKHACGKCGAKLAAGSKFCPECGEPAGAPA